jgi:hypothetical protein
MAMEARGRRGNPNPRLSKLELLAMAVEVEWLGCGVESGESGRG